jgi:hypothetical protein
MVELYHGIVGTLAWGGPGVDLPLSPATHSFDNQIVAEQATFEEFNLGSIGMLKPRWSRFLNQYLDLDDLRRWLPVAANVKRSATAGIMTKTVPGHTWGNCLVGIVFRCEPKPTLTLQSRTSSIVPTGGIDLAFGSVIAREIAHLRGIDQRDIRFIWTVSDLFLSGVYWLPYLSSLGLKTEEKFRKCGSKTAKTTERAFRRWISRYRRKDCCEHWVNCLRRTIRKRIEFCPYDDEECRENLPKFSPTARAIERYVRIQRGTMQKCLVKELILP